ncbi:MAG: nuclear transport factor 2 family protein [Ginsengibacter sp.]
MQNNNAEQEVTMVVEQLKNAFMKSETSFFEKYLASPYILIDPGGAVHNKADVIDNTKGDNFKFESIIPDDRKVILYENAALVTQHNTEKGHVRNEDISGEYRWIHILDKEGDDWKIVVMQGTQVIRGK